MSLVFLRIPYPLSSLVLSHIVMMGGVILVISTGRRDFHVGGMLECGISLIHTA